LFRDRFFDREAHVLREFFAADWSRLPDGTSDRVEPGHMAEWVWLLRRYAAHTAVPVDQWCVPLLERALALGRPSNADGFLTDLTDLAGVPQEDSRRLWRQTELIKALVVEARTRSEPALAGTAVAVSERLFRTYLAETPTGTWRDRFTLGGQPAIDHIPASTLYHLFGILAAFETP